jgi:hypothetical protein
MAETKEEIAAERDDLREQNERQTAEIENLRGQLAASGAAARTYAPSQQFALSEGDRQELVQRGVVNIGGRRMSREQVAAALPDSYANVDLGTAEPADGDLQDAERSKIRGVDFVYPSVEPGLIDPKVAGTPGINGPSADVSRETSSEDAQ